MKIQCDMCEKKEASVYCTADEASLCHACDRRVHHANKLANKHLRFSLHNSSDQPPLCDICQLIAVNVSYSCTVEKRAFLFCKEDRAILCKSCDISIHGANEHTQYHSRFLLAAVKLSESSSCYDSSSDQTLCSSISNGSSSRKSSIVSKQCNLRSTTNSTSVNDGCVSREDGVSMEASSITEYLTETLPGWHVEEFMDSNVSHPYGMFEGYEGGACTLPFMAHDTDSNGDLGFFWSEDLGNLVNSSSTMDHHISRIQEQDNYGRFHSRNKKF
ncbi:putative transcription factor interactor and regulator Znf-B family [Helianthus annuus]|nr:putative transcription factor interactor and regulator Znf-B family [Helianthus annuus]